MWIRGIVHSVHKLLQYGDGVTCDRPFFLHFDAYWH